LTRPQNSVEVKVLGFPDSLQKLVSEY
jgi:hypothetical protein